MQKSNSQDAGVHLKSKDSEKKEFPLDEKDKKLYKNYNEEKRRNKLQEIFSSDADRVSMLQREDAAEISQLDPNQIN